VGVLRQQVLPIRTDGDVVQFRQAVRKWASELRFSLVEQTKLVTAASELARNTLEHGGGGEGLLEILEEGPRQAIRLTFEDEGPGIPDVQLAMKDGYTTGGGLGLGLGGAKRLVNEFSIRSTPGQGTRVTVLRWK
jgi:serine/threonine-protein kinase RsbT